MGLSISSDCLLPNFMLETRSRHEQPESELFPRPCDARYLIMTSGISSNEDTQFHRSSLYGSMTWSLHILHTSELSAFDHRYLRSRASCVWDYRKALEVFRHFSQLIQCELRLCRDWCLTDVNANEVRLKLWKILFHCLNLGASDVERYKMTKSKRMMRIRWTKVDGGTSSDVNLRASNKQFSNHQPLLSEWDEICNVIRYILCERE